MKSSMEEGVLLKNIQMAMSLEDVEDIWSVDTKQKKKQ